MKTLFKNKQKLVTICVAVMAVIALMLPFALARPATVTLRVGQQTYALNIAATAAAQKKGLGGRETLARDRGMLFVFDTPGTQCFWMKDMQFPIDIIWLDSTKKVTSTVPNITPDSYPQQYCGDVTTKYVIELNTGEAKRAGIKIGDTLEL